MRAFTKDELLRLRPIVYLAAGYLDATGTPRREFLGDYATAAATQLMAASLSPQELALTVAGVRQLLPLQAPDDAAPDRLHAALDECLLVVARAIRQENNEGMVNWLSECTAAVETDADLDAFMAHIEATMRLYALLVAAQPDGSGSASQD